MGRVTYTPTDTVAAATASCNSIGCNITNSDIATGAGLPVRAGKRVFVVITNTTSSSCDNAPASSASAIGRIFYSTDGGVGFTEVVPRRSTCICNDPGGESCSTNKSSEATSISLGDMSDLSQIQVKAEAFATTAGSDTADGAANITAWHITAVTVIGIIGGE